MEYHNLILMFSMLVLASQTYEKCNNDPGRINYVLCDSFEDFQQFANFTGTIDVNNYNNAELSTLRSSHLVPCKYIDALVMKNVLNDIEPNAFVHLKSAKRLIIQYNDLKVVRANWFGESLQITLLMLQSNNIKDIDINTFKILTTLQRVYLDDNKLEEIKYGLFNNLSLSKVLVSNNKIEHIDKDAFCQMPNLSKLCLDGNVLSNFIAKEILNNSWNLEILWLHNNQLRQLYGYMFEGLWKLRILNLDNNKISFIEPQTFEYTPELTFLALAGNKLSSFQSNLLPDAGLAKLQYIKLDHNRLTFLASTTLYRMKSLKAISIYGNPWQCGCLDYILTWMYEANITSRCDGEYLTGIRPICVMPMSGAETCSYHASSNFFEDRYFEATEIYGSARKCSY